MFDPLVLMIRFRSTQTVELMKMLGWLNYFIPALDFADFEQSSSFSSMIIKGRTRASIRRAPCSMKGSEPSASILIVRIEG